MNPEPSHNDRWAEVAVDGASLAAENEAASLVAGKRVALA